MYGTNRTAADREYLRIHIRANSNEAADQSVKYLVRDAVVEYLTPIAAECTDKETAEQLIRSHLSGIESVADGVLQKNGFSYTAKASVRQEQFPTRVYGSVTLESGVYDALILELGTGEGDNWWCVIYPPLCFTATGGGKVEYRSRIYDIISEFFARRTAK